MCSRVPLGLVLVVDGGAGPQEDGDQGGVAPGGRQLGERWGRGRGGRRWRRWRRRRRGRWEVWGRWRRSWWRPHL